MPAISSSPEDREDHGSTPKADDAVQESITSVPDVLGGLRPPGDGRLRPRPRRADRVTSQEASTWPDGSPWPPLPQEPPTVCPGCRPLPGGPAGCDPFARWAGPTAPASATSSLLDQVKPLPVEVVGYWGDLDLDYVAERKLAQVGGDLFLDGSLGSHTAALPPPRGPARHLWGLYHDDWGLAGLATCGPAG